MEVPTSQGLNAKHSLEAGDRNPKWRNDGISPIDDSCDAACGLIHMDVVLQEIVMLDNHGVAGSEEKRESLPDLVYLSKQPFRQRQTLRNLAKKLVILFEQAGRLLNGWPIVPRRSKEPRVSG